MNGQRTFAIVLSAIMLTGCEATTIAGGETEREICRQIGSELPTRSRQDTPQTAAEIQSIYATFSLTCPDWAHLVP